MFNLFLIPAISFAALLNPSGAIHKLENVKLPTKVSLTVGTRSSDLISIGEGLRYKKIVFIKTKVYVGQLLSSDESLVIKEKGQILDSLSKQKAVAMQMTFLRDVDVKAIGGHLENLSKKMVYPLRVNQLKNS